VGMPAPAGGWKVSKDPRDQHRRSIYISVRRTAAYPMMSVFDMPEALESCSRRSQTITAPQALTMMNSAESMEWAQAFAGRVLERAGADPVKQVSEMFRLAYSREPDGWEKDRILTFFARQKALIGERSAKGEILATPTRIPDDVTSIDGSALVDVCLALINSNEFVYRF
jgi:hypothetical protein